jgi:hypothetical protein
MVTAVKVSLSARAPTVFAKPAVSHNHLSVHSVNHRRRCRKPSQSLVVLRRFLQPSLDCRQTVVKALQEAKQVREISLLFTCKTAYFWSGAEGIRTPDLRRAKAALSRLSYGPKRAWMVEFTAVTRRGLTWFGCSRALTE